MYILLLLLTGNLDEKEERRYFPLIHFVCAQYHENISRSYMPNEFFNLAKIQHFVKQNKEFDILSQYLYFR